MAPNLTAADSTSATTPIDIGRAVHNETAQEAVLRHPVVKFLMLAMVPPLVTLAWALRGVARLLPADETSRSAANNPPTPVAKPRKFAGCMTCEYCGGSHWDEDGRCAGCGAPDIRSASVMIGLVW